MIKYGESLFIPFHNGEGVPDAHYKARMYKSVEACRRALKRNFDRVEVVEYAPVEHGRWGIPEIIGYNGIHAVYGAPCSECGAYSKEHHRLFCSNCGAKMDGKEASDETSPDP